MNVKRLHENAILPTYAHETDSGFDLCAVEDTVIQPGETKIIKTGLAFDIPIGYEIQIRPRSGITSKTKLRVQLGTIDSGYCGEVGVIVDNISPIENKDGCLGTCLIDGTPEQYVSTIYQIKKGDRIAQGVLAPIVQCYFTEVDDLKETDRGKNGYGSTGV